MAKTSVEITLRLFDATALTDADFIVSDIQPFVDIGDLKLEISEPTGATLEPDQWVLDGGRTIFPDDMTTVNFGYWSLSKSIADKTIDVDMSIEFDSTHTTKGITVIFYRDDFATDIDVSWYDSSDILILTKNYTNDKYNFVADETVDDYKKVVLTFNELNHAEHNLKIKEIGFGTEILFSNSDIKTCTITEELDPISEEVSINTMNFNVLIKDSEYIQDIYSALMDKQKLIVKGFENSIKKDMGSFYLTTRTNPNEDTIEFKTQDILGVMSNETYVGGMFNDTAENVINDIMGSYGTSLFTVSDDIKDLMVSGYIPVTTYRRALQLVAFAVNAVVDCSRSEKVNVYKLPTINPQSVDNSRYFQGSTQTELTAVTGVSLNLKSYSVGSGTTEVYNVTLAAGTYRALFSEPVTSLSITGGTITSSGANYAEFTTTGATVVITGTPYNVSNQLFIVYSPDITTDTIENTEEYENTLIWDGLENVGHLYDKLTGLSERKVRLILENEKVGDFVSIDALYDNQIEGYITSNTIDLSGGFISSSEIVGVIK